MVDSSSLDDYNLPGCKLWLMNLEKMEFQNHFKLQMKLQEYSLDKITHSFSNRLKLLLLGDGLVVFEGWIDYIAILTICVYIDFKLIAWR